MTMLFTENTSTFKTLYSKEENRASDLCTKDIEQSLNNNHCVNNNQSLDTN